MADINKRPKGEGKRYRGNPNLMKARRQIDDIQSRLDKVKTQPPTSAKYPDKVSFTKADKEQKDKANQQSIKNLKAKKPHLYKEGWLTEGYKKIDKMKDLARTSSQIDRLDSDAGKAAAKGDYAKEFRKDQQGANVQTHFALRNTPNLAGRNQIANIKQSTRNQMIGARDRKYGIKPTRRRKLKPNGFHDNYVDKLRRKKVEEGYKAPNFKKMDKQIKKHKEDNIRIGPDPQEMNRKYRNDSRNKAFKMSGIRDALLRGEDPRQDTRGGAFKKRGNPDQDHRAGYTKNPMNNPPRRVKNPGVGEKGDQKGGRKRGINRVYGTTRLISDGKGGYSGSTKPLGKKKDINEGDRRFTDKKSASDFYKMSKMAKNKGKIAQSERLAGRAKNAETREQGRKEVKSMFNRPHFKISEEQRPLPMDKMKKQSDRHFQNLKTELGKARNSRNQATDSTDVRRFRRQQFNKDERTEKVANFVRRRNTIDNEIDKRNANPKAYASKRSRKSNKNKAIGKLKRMM